LLTVLIGLYQRLSQAAAELGKIATIIVDILKRNIVQTTVRTDLPGQFLQIQIAVNSYPVFFPAPTRIPPKTHIYGSLPGGVSASVSDASEISFTATFLPFLIPAARFGFVADAEL
jgi:hypothetical protein